MSVKLINTPNVHAEKNTKFELLVSEILAAYSEQWRYISSDLPVKDDKAILQIHY